MLSRKTQLDLSSRRSRLNQELPLLHHQSFNIGTVIMMMIIVTIIIIIDTQDSQVESLFSDLKLQDLGFQVQSQFWGQVDI